MILQPSWLVEHPILFVDQAGSAVMQIKEYQDFIKSLNEKIDSKQTDLENIYTIFDPKDSIAIETINKNLSNTKVPVKFKEFHLLFSRSLLRLSSYISTANPDDMLAGLELFDQAKEEYSELDIG